MLIKTMYLRCFLLLLIGNSLLMAHPVKKHKDLAKCMGLFAKKGMECSQMDYEKDYENCRMLCNCDGEIEALREKDFEEVIKGKMCYDGVLRHVYEDESKFDTVGLKLEDNLCAVQYYRLSTGDEMEHKELDGDSCYDHELDLNGMCYEGECIYKDEISNFDISGKHRKRSVDQVMSARPGPDEEEDEVEWSSEETASYSRSESYTSRYSSVSETSDGQTSDDYEDDDHQEGSEEYESSATDDLESTPMNNRNGSPTDVGDPMEMAGGTDELGGDSPADSLATDDMAMPGGRKTMGDSTTDGFAGDKMKMAGRNHALRGGNTSAKGIAGDKTKVRRGKDALGDGNSPAGGLAGDKMKMAGGKDGLGDGGLAGK